MGVVAVVVVEDVVLLVGVRVFTSEVMPLLPFLLLLSFVAAVLDVVDEVVAAASGASLARAKTTAPQKPLMLNLSMQLLSSIR